jgi:GT2 family glycosyltransferase
VGVAPDDTIAVPASDAPHVSIVIPTMRQSRLLADCLRSLAPATSGAPPCETIVVLNAADDETTDLVRARVRDARIVASDVNLGVAGGGNLGREAARGELLVFLHDDATCEPGWLAALIDVVEARPDAGAVGSRVLDPGGGLQSAGSVVFRDGSSCPMKDASVPEPVHAADYCSSSSLLVHVEAWDAVGGMDERLFPAYHVDADLGLAIWALGRTVLCARESRVRHRQRSSSSGRFREFLWLRNRAQLREKWGTALADHVPCPDGPEAAIPAARARVEAAAERIRVGFRPATGPRRGDRAPSAGPEARERAALARAAEVHTAYIAALEAELTASEERERHAHRAAGDAAERLDEAGRTLDAIYTGGWWRLRARLRQALRLAGRLRRPG